MTYKRCPAGLNRAGREVFEEETARAESELLNGGAVDDERGRCGEQMSWIRTEGVYLSQAHKLSRSGL